MFTMLKPNPFTGCLNRSLVLVSSALTPGPRRVFWSCGEGGGGLNRSRKDESSSGIPGARSRGKILKFKSSEMAGNESSKPIYIDKRPIKELKGLKDSRSIIIHYYTEKLITLATKLNASGQLQKL